MNLRRALSRDCQVCAIKHGLFGSHVVIDNFQDNYKLAYDNLPGVLLISEESQVLPDTDA